MIRRFMSGRTGILPRDGGGEPWLAAVIAVLCFLACLSAVGAAAADRAAHGWTRQLRAEATVQVRPRVGETGAEAAAPELELTPYAVETPSLDDSRWWRAAVTARRMTLEYMKYLAALGRALIGQTGERPATGAEAPVEKAA